MKYCAAVTDITNTTDIAAVGGNVTSDGGATLTASAVCWTTSPNPTTADYHTTNSGGTGSFASTLAGLTPGTIYYVRAYATNIPGEPSKCWITSILGVNRHATAVDNAYEASAGWYWQLN
ncbi:MAG: hypothetical protein M0Q38_06665 [Bacteroidales bacterium]|jgi:hypothetical protein|nr:hypothetical protein [Bacteroidales bacterium]